ncbi:zinc-ribbon domain-containing protein [Paenibacillus aquistagni]|uniref:zinc-ribbon domain-containing protein n=1 Tax=Paenibacillus aquistagni TaxID=1852522 RepID=UPI00145B896F|nr:zinc-ribbon domain-containing protein [Paenibacillus aquistagni]NMM53420.1 zinc-ribbon domain-containing protein [Paenibacillus aquistagni]
MRRPAHIINKYKSCDSLADVDLDFVREWHTEFNSILKPCDFKPQSNKKVWWKCRNGHSWQARIQRRLFGDGCPYCSGKKVSIDNCLVTVNCKLSNQWNSVRNKGISPFDVTAGSTKKVWWICEKGHEWEARIDHRSNGSGCPMCRKGK